jgi:hypothetical protein
VYLFITLHFVSSYKQGPRGPTTTKFFIKNSGICSRGGKGKRIFLAKMIIFFWHTFGGLSLPYGDISKIRLVFNDENTGRLCCYYLSPRLHPKTKKFHKIRYCIRFREKEFVSPWLVHFVEDIGHCLVFFFATSR